MTAPTEEPSTGDVGYVVTQVSGDGEGLGGSVVNGDRIPLGLIEPLAPADAVMVKVLMAKLAAMV